MYEQEITRQHRAAFVIAVDQSLSMRVKMEYHQLELEASEVVSIVVGKLIEELILRATREGVCRNYYDVAVVGYADGEVYSLLGNKIEFVPITELAKRNVRHKTYRLTLHSQRQGDIPILESVPIWIEPAGWGSTPVIEMLERVTDLVEGWCAEPQHRDSFPPIVFHITDGRCGEGQEARLMEVAQRLRSISTNDGEVLLVNIHIAGSSHLGSILLPTISEIEGCGAIARRLWRMSSELPKPLEWYAVLCRRHYAPPPYRTLSYNASPLDFVAMLSIGTRSVDIKI